MMWLRDTMKAVKFNGFVEVNKAQLLDSIDYKKDTEGAWSVLLSEYQKVAGSSARLHMVYAGDRVILLRNQSLPVH